MFTPTESTIIRKKQMSVEEYKQLKRRLFTLRCQYTKLLSAIRDYGETPTRLQRCKKLERRIDKIELTLAQAEIEMPDDGPITFSELAAYAQDAGRKVYAQLDSWTAPLRIYMRTRFASQQRVNDDLELLKPGSLHA